MFDLFQLFIDDTSFLEDSFDSSGDFPGDFTLNDNYLQPDSLFESDAPLLFSSPDIIEANPPSEIPDFTHSGGILDDLWALIEPYFSIPPYDSINLVDPSLLTHNGCFDPINNCIVEGDVASDIHFIQQQTGPTCSLMAQEQFIERITGDQISEEELERIASQMGIYDPNMGTSYDGWNAILNYYGIDNTRYYPANAEMLDAATRNGDDILIGVDAQKFYNDPTIPPGSGHAVAIVGRGVDPSSGQLNGYYITDSNYPGQAHFKTVAELEWMWERDMITVPTTMTV